MPQIIAAPVRTRNDSRTVTEATMDLYIQHMNEAGEGNIVVVDDSMSDNYEKTYAHGERILQAIYKRDGNARKIKVVSPKDGAGNFYCAMSWK